ncbi:hypothetical protein AQI95_40585 [Streptomyces yokosukanensis]|uniref:Uncharacterized protein n=1 Tax=Streptomyces yokosukanensis TaxID=67386 RepID=A0A101NTI1_9ACTN|nr:hypothetical protein [Streptomyces yokosukanensis]KUM99088.1 hypothetical protein AQI95_40585 [Streptomyces yokosukanensis]
MTEKPAPTPERGRHPSGSSPALVDMPHQALPVTRSGAPGAVPDGTPGVEASFLFNDILGKLPGFPGVVPPPIVSSIF